MAGEQKNHLKITRQQQRILALVYTYRFINRIQLQKLIRHKDYKRINVWLKHLRENHYLEWIYSTDFAEKTKPGVYYLGLNGIRHFNDHPHIDYSKTELRKRYHDRNRSQAYIDRCQLIAGCAVTFDEHHRDANKSSKTGNFEYRYLCETETEYCEESYFHALYDNELIRPQLCISKFKCSSDDMQPTATYLLEVFDLTLPRYRLKKRLGNYIEFLEDGEWEERFEELGDPSPSLMFVCQRTTDLIFAKRHMRGLIAETWDYEDADRPKAYFTTAKQFKTEGFLGDIWEMA